MDSQRLPTKTYHCQTRQNIGQPACGDKVVWHTTNEDPDAAEGVITALMPRDTVLTRTTFSGEDKPLAANITQLIIVVAPRPEPSTYLIDQYLIAAERIGTRAIIAINKADLLSQDEKWKIMEQFSYYPELGYELIFVSAHQIEGLIPLQHKLQGHTSILVGQSGVGKSSLTNALIPELQLETRQLSEKKQLGQHTTSASTLYALGEDAWLIDSPGVRSFRLGSIDLQTLENGFVEIRALLGDCRFSNCRHETEPGCALQAAVEQGKINPQRLENFKHMAAKL